MLSTLSIPDSTLPYPEEDIERAVALGYYWIRVTHLLDRQGRAVSHRTEVRTSSGPLDGARAPERWEDVQTARVNPHMEQAEKYRGRVHVFLRTERLRGLEETIGVCGLLRIRELPEEWSEADYLKYWCGERDEQGRMLQKPRISEKEKERYTVLEARNQLMVQGRGFALSYLGATNGNASAFGKYLAIGTGALQATSPTDTQLVNEVFRVLQSANTVQGSQVDINFQLTAANAQVVMTESGLFGGSASSTANSGTLCTHVLFSYTKGAFPISCDYIINLI
jgi:hypothetical protein